MNATTVSTEPKKAIGWYEWVQLPQLGLPLIKAKIDTGARTSALHAFDIETFKRRGVSWVRFKIHPLQRNNKLTIQCEAPVVDRRLVTDSGGKGEKRLVIETLATIGGVTRRIEVTLTNREKMVFRMLLGRQGIGKFDFVVNPNHTAMLGKIKSKVAAAVYTSKLALAPTESKPTPRKPTENKK